jgi:steroid Delta-isomerase
MSQEQPKDDCARIFVEWDARARARDVEGLLALYAADATLESPLVPAILDDMQTGVLRGHTELRRFFEEGGRRRPNALVRWYRAGKYLCDGKTLIWEYPREAPDGDQVDITEVMDIADGKIQRHRIYWGWFGLAMLQRSREQKS